MTVPNYPALVLNADFTPVNVHPLSTWNFERTLRNHLKGRITPLEFYDSTLRSPSFEYQPPSVIALKTYIRKPQHVAFTRMNIFLRDDFRCQYCSGEFLAKDLTFDHVTPRCNGGDTSYENIVSCCVPCNTKKGSSMDMRPVRTPKAPSARQLARARPPREKLHDSWLDYLYWSGVLEQ
jgi:5-methylcytosine-specific restriction endonuclease McrA